jgi:hypothetical protein
MPRNVAVRHELPTEADKAKMLVREIAMDIGKEAAAHLEIMYPNAVKATSRNMLLSVRNCVHNEIIAAIQVTDEGKIVARLDERRGARRKIKAAWKNTRKDPP